MFLNTDESSAYDFLHEKMRSNVFILTCFVIVIGCELACVQTGRFAKNKRAVRAGGDMQGERRRMFPSLASFSDAVNDISDWPTECQPVHTNFKGVPSVVMRLSLFVPAQKKNSVFRSVFGTSSSAVLKLQRIFLKIWTKNTSGKGGKLSCAFISKNNSNQQSPQQFCVFSTRFIGRIFRRHEVLRF